MICEYTTLMIFMAHAKDGVWLPQWVVTILQLADLLMNKLVVEYVKE